MDNKTEILYAIITGIILLGAFLLIEHKKKPDITELKEKKDLIINVDSLNAIKFKEITDSLQGAINKLSLEQERINKELIIIRHRNDQLYKDYNNISINRPKY